MTPEFIRKFLNKALDTIEQTGRKMFDNLMSDEAYLSIPLHDNEEFAKAYAQGYQDAVKHAREAVKILYQEEE